MKNLASKDLEQGVGVVESPKSKTKPSQKAKFRNNILTDSEITELSLTLMNNLEIGQDVQEAYTNGQVVATVKGKDSFLPLDQEDETLIAQLAEQAKFVYHVVYGSLDPFDNTLDTCIFDDRGVPTYTTDHEPIDLQLAIGLAIEQEDEPLVQKLMSGSVDPEKQFNQKKYYFFVPRDIFTLLYRRKSPHTIISTLIRDSKHGKAYAYRVRSFQNPDGSDKYKEGPYVNNMTLPAHSSTATYLSDKEYTEILTSPFSFINASKLITAVLGLPKSEFKVYDIDLIKKATFLHEVIDINDNYQLAAIAYPVDSVNSIEGALWGICGEFHEYIYLNRPDEDQFKFSFGILVVFYDPKGDWILAFVEADSKCTGIEDYINGEQILRYHYFHPDLLGEFLILDEHRKEIRDKGLLVGLRGSFGLKRSK